MAKSLNGSGISETDTAYQGRKLDSFLRKNMRNLRVCNPVSDLTGPGSIIEALPTFEHCVMRRLFFTHSAFFYA